MSTPESPAFKRGKELKQPDPRKQPGFEAVACLFARCGTCEQTYPATGDDAHGDVDSTVHFDTATEALTTLGAAGWHVDPDVGLECRRCAALTECGRAGCDWCEWTDCGLCDDGDPIDDHRLGCPRWRVCQRCDELEQDWFWRDEDQPLRRIVAGDPL